MSTYASSSGGNRKRGSNKGILKARRHLRRTQAEQRAIEHAARTGAEQELVLRLRPGEATRERERLAQPE